MLEKELIVGFVAFNLIRHALIQVGNAFKVSYRQFSFSRFLIRLRALEGTILSERISDDMKTLAINRALTDYRSLLLPVRTKKRPNEPRKVWPKGTLHILRGSRKKERQKLNKVKNLGAN